MVNFNLNFRFRPHRQCHLELKVEVEFKVRTWMSAAVFGVIQCHVPSYLVVSVWDFSSYPPLLLVGCERLPKRNLQYNCSVYNVYLQLSNTLAT